MAWLATVTVTHEILIEGRGKPEACEILSMGYGQGDTVDVELSGLERFALPRCATRRRPSALSPAQRRALDLVTGHQSVESVRKSTIQSLLKRGLIRDTGSPYPDFRYETVR